MRSLSFCQALALVGLSLGMDQEPREHWVPNAVAPLGSVSNVEPVQLAQVAETRPSVKFGHLRKEIRDLANFLNITKEELRLMSEDQIDKLRRYKEWRLDYDTKSYLKCKNSGQYFAVDQDECRQNAEDSGHVFYQFRDDTKLCASAEECEDPHITVWPWRVFRRDSSGKHWLVYHPTDSKDYAVNGPRIAESLIARSKDGRDHPPTSDGKAIGGWGSREQRTKGKTNDPPALR